MWTQMVELLSSYLNSSQHSWWHISMLWTMIKPSEPLDSTSSFQISSSFHGPSLLSRQPGWQFTEKVKMCWLVLWDSWNKAHGLGWTYCQKGTSKYWEAGHLNNSYGNRFCLGGREPNSLYCHWLVERRASNASPRSGSSKFPWKYEREITL